MTQEEKAKAYDRVSKEVKDFFEGRQKMYSDVTQTLEYLQIGRRGLYSHSLELILQVYPLF